MICPECRDGLHATCANLVTAARTSSFIDKHGSWCDCQHQPGTSLGVTGETSPAPVHVPA